MLLQECFVETCWDDEAIVRQRRDARRQELEAMGLRCRSEDLYRIQDGRRVFVVVAEPPEVESLSVMREKRVVSEKRPAGSSGVERPASCGSVERSPLLPNKKTHFVERRVKIRGYETK